MAYRLPGGRVPLTPDGYDGLQVEVEPIGAYPIYRAAVELVTAFYAADSGTAAEFELLTLTYGHFLIEAQPSWAIVDHRGAVHPTPAGMLRLPTELGLALVTDWAALFVAEPAETAVDKLIPEGPLRDELNTRLRAVA
jgi:hypothetical protein